MSRFALRRSRLVAAAAISLTGTIAAGALNAPAAQAECVEASVYVYKNKQGRDYVVRDYCAYNVPGWPQLARPHAGKETDSNDVPPGTPTGAGFSVWIVSPPVR